MTEGGNFRRDEREVRNERTAHIPPDSCRTWTFANFLGRAKPVDSRFRGNDGGGGVTGVGLAFRRSGGHRSLGDEGEGEPGRPSEIKCKQQSTDPFSLYGRRLG